MKAFVPNGERKGETAWNWVITGGRSEPRNSDQNTICMNDRTKDDILMQEPTSRSRFNIVELKRLTQEPYSSVVCYPKPSKGELRRRLVELHRLRISRLTFTGQKEVSKLRVLGKGCVGAEGATNIQRTIIARELLGKEYIPYR